METDKKKYVVWGIFAVFIIAAIISQVNRPGIRGANAPVNENGTAGQAANQSQSQSQSQNIFGTVDSISGQNITVKTAAPNADSSVGSATISIATDNSTVFEKIVLKDQDILQKEFVEFSAKSKTDKNAAPPTPFNRVKISLSDIKKGDSIMAVVVSGDKVISILVQPPAPALNR